jgi:hypothetical protein
VAVGWRDAAWCYSAVCSALAGEKMNKKSILAVIRFVHALVSTASLCLSKNPTVLRVLQYRRARTGVGAIHHILPVVQVD